MRDRDDSASGSGRMGLPLGGAEARRSGTWSEGGLMVWMALLLAGGGSVIGCSGKLEPIVASRADPAGSVPAAPGAATDGAPAVSGDQTWGYDAGLEGWQLYELSPEDALTDTVLAWDSVLGNPAAGSVRLQIPFSAARQQVRLGLRLAEPINLTGKRLSVLLLLQSGLNVDPAQPGGALVYASSGDEWIWANGSWTVLSQSGEWVQGWLDVDNPEITYDGFDPTDVREIGVTVQTGEVGEHTPAVLNVDTFAVSGV